jgi:outer membrane protein assembly factor BamB
MPTIAVCLMLAQAAPATTAEKYWPQWRGPYATGVSKTADPPIEWSETKNVKWKVEIPGRGSASPIVWGDRVFVLTAVPAGASGAEAHAPQGGRKPRQTHKFVVMALDRKTGKVAWERTAREWVPNEGSHPDNGTYASSSAITDGRYVYAFFDSAGLYAYDMDGTLIWEKDLGDKQMRNEFGEGCTPVLHGDRLVIVWDHQGPSFITALDKATGKELWRTERQEIDTWATPLVVEHGGRAQVVTSGMNKVRSYDLETGKVVWEGPGLTMNPIPSPVYEDGIVYATSGFRGNSLRAIRIADAKGDISSTPAQVWSLDHDTPYVPSPLLYGDLLYLLKSNNGVLTCLDAKTGERIYGPERIEAVPNVYASPIGAGGRVYVAGREGTTAVLEAGRSFKVLATNTLEDGFDASPVAVDKELYLRGRKYLYRISE